MEEELNFHRIRIYSLYEKDKTSKYNIQVVETIPNRGIKSL